MHSEQRRVHHSPLKLATMSDLRSFCINRGFLKFFLGILRIGQLKDFYRERCGLGTPQPANKCKMFNWPMWQYGSVFVCRKFRNFLLRNKALVYFTLYAGSGLQVRRRTMQQNSDQVWLKSVGNFILEMQNQLNQSQIKANSGALETHSECPWNVIMCASWIGTWRNTWKAHLVW